MVPPVVVNSVIVHGSVGEWGIFWQKPAHRNLFNYLGLVGLEDALALMAHELVSMQGNGASCIDSIVEIVPAGLSFLLLNCSPVNDVSVRVQGQMIMHCLPAMFPPGQQLCDAVAVVEEGIDVKRGRFILDILVTDLRIL